LRRNEEITVTDYSGAPRLTARIHTKDAIPLSFVQFPGYISNFLWKKKTPYLQRLLQTTVVRFCVTRKYYRRVVIS